MRTNPERLVTMATTFLMVVVSNIFLHNRCVFLFLTYTNVYQVTCTKKYHVTERFIRHSGIVGPRHGIYFESCFMTPYCTKKKPPRESQVQGSVQKCGSSLWNLFFVTFLLPRIWIFGYFVDLCVNQPAILSLTF